MNNKELIALLKRTIQALTALLKKKKAEKIKLIFGENNYSDRPLSDITVAVIHHSAGYPRGNRRIDTGDVNREHGKFTILGQKREGAISISCYENGEVQKINFPDISYHFLIEPNGKWIQTRDLELIGYHAGNWAINSHSVGICMLGHFEQSKPSEGQIKALRGILDVLASAGVPITEVGPHSKYREGGTLCCGKYLVEALTAQGILTKD